MRAETDGGGMVGEDHYLEVLSCALEIFIDGGEYLFIDKLDCENLVFGFWKKIRYAKG